MERFAASKRNSLNTSQAKALRVAALGRNDRVRATTRIDRNWRIFFRVSSQRCRDGALLER
jgi:hypothetical protein